MYADLGVVGGGELQLLDDGRHEDGQVGDRLFANVFQLPAALPPRAKSMGIVTEDDAGRVSSVPIMLRIASPDDRLQSKR